MSSVALELCRICRIRPADSDEHFIPRATGNKALVRLLTLGADGKYVEVPASGGATVSVLCTQCNNGVGSKYAGAYTYLYRQFCNAPHITDTDGRLRIHADGVFALRFIKQVILAFIAVAAWEPQPEWLTLQEFLADPTALLPPSAPSIYLYYNLASIGRIVPSCGLVSLADAHAPATLSELSWPPLGIVISYAWHPALQNMHDVTRWGQQPYGQRIDEWLAVPRLVVNTLYPLAFGSEEEISKQQEARLSGYLLHIPTGSSHPFQFPALIRRVGHRGA